MEEELVLAQAITGDPPGEVNPLKTDGYKFAMAQAGFPLRKEKFVLTLRKGGPHYIPFDMEKVVRAMLPRLPTVKEAAFLTANGYGMTPAMEQALGGKVEVWAAPKGSWVNAREPVLTLGGPSFLVSWPEALDIMLQYPIQIATAIKKGVRDFPAVCPDEVTIIQVVARAMGLSDVQIHLDDAGYRAGVRKNVQAVLDALMGDAHRAFEVGMRAATCVQQHMIALEECRSLCVFKTANVYGAWKLYMIPVGTTGHEHQERHGLDDRIGFRAVRDLRPEPPSYLFDTNDPIHLGVPAMLEVMAENPDRPCSARFDSGDQDAQLLKLLAGCRKEYPAHDGEPARFEDMLHPNTIFEDGYDAERTAKNERFCEARNWPRERRFYGYGGFWIACPHPTPYKRDEVSAAYKLCWSVGPRMKFSGSPGKASPPGHPCIYRRLIYGTLTELGLVADSLIAQEGESIPGFAPLDPRRTDQFVPNELRDIKTKWSPATAKMIEVITAERDALIERLSARGELGRGSIHENGA